MGMSGGPPKKMNGHATTGLPDAAMRLVSRAGFNYEIKAARRLALDASAREDTTDLGGNPQSFAMRKGSYFARRGECDRLARIVTGKYNGFGRINRFLDGKASRVQRFSRV
jgi:hypothetical protein